MFKIVCPFAYSIIKGSGASIISETQAQANFRLGPHAGENESGIESESELKFILIYTTKKSKNISNIIFSKI